MYILGLDLGIGLGDCRFIYSWTESKSNSFRVCEFISLVRHFMIANELKWGVGPPRKKFYYYSHKEWWMCVLNRVWYILSIVCQRGLRTASFVLDSWYIGWLSSWKHSIVQWILHWFCPGSGSGSGSTLDLPTEHIHRMAMDIHMRMYYVHPV